MIQKKKITLIKLSTAILMIRKDDNNDKAKIKVIINNSYSNKKVMVTVKSKYKYSY